VAVKIKLKRLGKIRAPYYRIVVADSRTKRDGRAIEEIGKYHPKAEPSFIEVDSERAQHWLSVGAQPTDPVRKILEITGDWQKFKGLPGAEGTLRVAEPKADRKIAFAAALQETLGDGGAATAPKSKPRARSAEPAAAKPARPEKADAGQADAEKADKGGKAGAEKASAEKASTEKASAEKASAEKASKAKADEPATAAAPAPAAAAPAAAAPADAATADAATADPAADAASSEG
jgi:small subunit ribosomal protein S16